ncbi:lamin tail domain-containing protein [Streptomyces sp. NPDC048442]|uniref:lamin tail domain-containing protein n=1 Tax=Streptomyces sp. NPDC048442 TaxID=3154823 RepID=UPI0034438B56
MSTARSRTTRRLAAAVLAAGAVVGAIALPATAATPSAAASSAAAQATKAPRPSIIIGQVQYNSPGYDDGSNRSLNGEWVEIRNLGRHSVNLRDYSLTDRQGHRYYFDRLRLEGRSSVKVHTGEGHDRYGHVYQDRHRYVWNNDRDTATLRNDRGRLVDSVSWGRGRH